MAGQNANDNWTGQLKTYMTDGRLHLASFEYRSGGITLRENIADDAPYLLRWFNDHENVKWMDLPDSTYTNEKIIEGIRFPGLWTLDMTVLKDGTPIGYCSIYDIHENEAELSLLIGEKGMQRRGYSNDIVKGMRDIGFDILELKKLHAFVNHNNKPSLRAFLKNGFSEYSMTENDIYLELIKR